MRTTTDLTEQVWLDYTVLQTPARLICATYGLTPEGLRELLRREVVSYGRWRRRVGLDTLRLVCPACGVLMGPQVGMRTVAGRALCCLCALDEELAEEVAQ